MELHEPDARVLHYLGALAGHTPTNRLRISPADAQPASEIWHDRLYVQNAHAVCEIVRRDAMPWGGSGYLRPFAQCLQRSATDLTAPVRFMLGDHTALPDGQRVGTIMKARRCEYVERPVILPFNYGRHWGNVPAAMANETPLADRRDVCVWRGATTGRDDDAGSRMCLAGRWDTEAARRDGIDIAFSQNVQGKAEALRNRLTPAEQMACKYVVSARGNDKDSGLNWKLASGSVVLMTKPHIESWLMESTLVDRVHYVRVSDDWSDLGEKVEWCRANPAACEAIAANARRFMRRFGTPDEEASLAADVLREYFARTE